MIRGEAAEVGDLIRPIGWGLPGPSPAGEVIGREIGSMGNSILIVNWSDGRKAARVAAAICEVIPTKRRMPAMFVVTIKWPADPERGSETYGPFEDEIEQADWVDQCQDAADHGWRLLVGAEYLLHRVSDPFDPTALWEQSNDAMKVGGE